MKIAKKLKAQILPTVMVVSILLLLLTFVLLSLWESDLWLFSRNEYIEKCRSNIESAYVLYESHPELFNEMDDSLCFNLYDSIASSVIIKKKTWGLYHWINIASDNANIKQHRLYGITPSSVSQYNLYYTNGQSSLTLVENTNLQGSLALPEKGIIYGHSGNQFFSGEPVSPSNIQISEAEIPQPSQNAKKEIQKLRQLKPLEIMSDDSISQSFSEMPPLIYAVNEYVGNTILSGNIILCGDDVIIGSNAVIENIILIANRVIVESGFKGSLQIFAKDSVWIDSKVKLTYPSGVYSQKYIEVRNKCEIEGYIIVDVDNYITNELNYYQSKTSILRGLLYVNGISQIQGIVSGKAFLNRCIYKSTSGYSVDLMSNMSLLQNDWIAYPLWVTDNSHNLQMMQICSENK